MREEHGRHAGQFGVVTAPLRLARFGSRPVGLSNINVREMQCRQKDSGSFGVRLIH
jgi:hypothetical protein